MFSISLVTIDSYQSAPLPNLDVIYSDFRGAEIKQVPVIRIFGSTSTGRKTCLHVHGIFPYMFIPCTIEKDVDSFMYRLAAGIDSAINVSLGCAMSNKQHVYKIQQVSGIPIYGYHKREHLFFKIYFYNPAMIKRAADLLHNGAILNQSLQPHEAHIPFILQFMIDYNLYGMSFVNVSNIKYRHRTRTGSKENSQNERSSSFANSQEYLPAFITRQSTCELEGDAQASDILNREEVTKGLELNPGIAAIWNDEKIRRDAKGLRHAESQLLYSKTSEERVYSKTDNDILQEERLARRLEVISQTNETITSSTTDTLSYPVEVEDEGIVLSASHVLNHLELTVPNRESPTKVLLNESLQFGGAEPSEQAVSYDQSASTSILDLEDMHLVELLADLARQNDEETIVDNDSMLGSQFSTISNEIQDDKEDEEVENLNITSFDLDSLSSWGSIAREPSQSKVVKIHTDDVEEGNEDVPSVNLPQYDGVNDLFVNKSKLEFTKSVQKKAMEKAGMKVFKKHTCEFKSRRRKDRQAVKLDDRLGNVCYDENMLKACKLDHRDLDVYDADSTDGIDLNESNERVEQITRNVLHVDSQKSINCDQRKFSMHLSIPAFDGNTINSSDSETDPDVTIERQENRICVYKSSAKSKSKDVVVTPKKRRLENSEYESPSKRRNINYDSSPRQSNNTPTKTKVPRSPHRLSGKYSPLNITVISPKVKRNAGNSGILSKNEPSTSKSSSAVACTTPRRKKHELRVRLLREKNCELSSKKSRAHPEDASENVDVPFESELNVNAINETFVIESGDLEKEPLDIAESSESRHSISKANKEVRKRLSFLSNNEKETVHLEIPLDQDHSESLPLAEHIIDEENEDNNPADICVNNFNYETSIRTRENVIETTDCAQDVKDLDNSVRGTNLEPDLDEEDNVCDLTFTQYINQKLGDDSQFSILADATRSDLARKRSVVITTKFNPPSRERIAWSMNMYGISKHKFEQPFFSNKSDFIKQKEHSSKNPHIPDVAAFKSNLDGITGIKLWRRMKVNEFHPSGSNIKSDRMKRALAGYKSTAIQPLVHPPSSKDVKLWLKAKAYLLKKNTKAEETKKSPVEENSKGETKCSEASDVNSTDLQSTRATTKESQPPKDHSQNSNKSELSCGSSDTVNSTLRKILENPKLYNNDNTQEHLGISYGQIEYSLKEGGNVADENLQNARALTVHQYLTLLSLEVHVVTRGDLLPDPECDSIQAVFYAIHNDVPISSHVKQMEHGAIIASSFPGSVKLKNIHSTSVTCSLSYVESEEDLLNSVVTLIRLSDPDMLLGWELETLSWGYLFQRAISLGFNNFMWQISRIPHATQTAVGQTADKDNLNDQKIPGRIVLDVWRIMRHEAALMNYTFENVMYNVMHERISCPTFQTLSGWWNHRSIVMRWRVIDHYVTRVLGTLRILMQLDVIGRTCEHAKLIGIQFYEVFSRGSQFRVESMMLRLAKPLNYICVSPAVQQRARMRAPESLPLIMEPQSIFYTDPLIVLDFQSLYPSMIIAYNYCFSTCLGRIEHIGQNEPYEFGATTLRIKKSDALKLQGKVNYAPCGVAFVKSEVRQGILPRMLSEILNTRLMVKESLKIHGSENRVLQRVLDSQQLGLKLIANVTYGYTAANFSGRMPCMEIADSVVSKGRETLERAIKIVESTPKWGAQVVYGDTDSLFILLSGKSREEAFVIGAEIADTVTAANPRPVKLKFEKVLHPSILQTKKRYCGYMYEYPEQKEPVYLAKGIETVRRDGCPAVAKILEKSLKILFDTKDFSLIKQYVVRQFDKILRRKISIQDLTFAKEFRGLKGYKASACVPALELTRRLMRKDPRAVPRTSERVRYIVVAGAPNQPLIHCIRTPMEVILDEGLSPNSIYYITKVIIPPLNRCFNLIGVDVNTWYREMSHRQTPDKAVSLFADNQKSTIRQFFSTVVCPTCGEQTKTNICPSCLRQPHQTVIILHEKIRWLERTYHELNTICQSCTGYTDDPRCESLDCPILYRLADARRNLVQIPYLNGIINDGNSECLEKKT